MLTPAGSHLILELYDCHAPKLMDTLFIQQQLQSAAQQLSATVIGQHFHSFGEASGVTGVLLLQESHISIHSWPEYQYAALDIFMCGKRNMQPVIDALVATFESRRHSAHILERGDALSFGIK